MARDPARIPAVLERLGKLWKRYPQLRLGQLIGNVVEPDSNSLYYVEDEELITRLEAGYAKIENP
jgi:hypothetical protein